VTTIGSSALRERDDGDGGSDERSADVESDSNAAGTADESGPDDERPGTTGRPSGSASEEPGVAGDTDRSADDDPKGSDDTDGSPFSRDFASALEDAPDPNTGSEGPGAGGGGPFGGGSNGDDPLGGDSTDPFGGGSGGDGTDPLDGGGGDGFGFDGFGGDEPGSFDEDEAEFDSNLDRHDVGIDGLDQMILGGVPERSLMVAIGSAGTGKTTFGLQFLNRGLVEGENGVYITVEEGFERIVSTADEKGWGFREYVDDDRLAVVDIDPVEMSNSLDSIQNDLPDLIEEFGADRLVLDSVSLLEMMYESAPQRRSQVFGFARALKEAGITILLTSEADRNHAYASRYGIVEYLADAVFVLRYVRPSDFRETRLAIEIQKIRNANHSRETKPYDLTDDGINVYRQANIF
jgi:KaiC domain protein